MVNQNAPLWQRIYAIPGMLIFGTATVVTQKFLFEQEADGIEKYGHHQFRKPWFQTDVMFLGMTLSLFAYLVIGRKEHAEAAVGKPQKQGSRWKLYFGCALPSICDLTATSLTNVQLLYLNASVWQMLRGSTTIFSLIFSAFILAFGKR